MRRPISLYGLTFSLPLLIWQILFFVFPLLFLVALSFWTVKNFVMSPDFDTVNWVTMYGRGVFWQAYGTTFALATAAAGQHWSLSTPRGGFAPMSAASTTCR